MNRPKQYDREEVLDKTTVLFWEKGFEATSMNDIVTRTGVQKFSIYNEFGDKEKLFLACMDHFLLNYCFVEEILAKEPLGLKNIEAFFEYKVHSYGSQANNGCLIFNSVIEKDIISEAANLKVDTFVSKMKILFNNCLNAAQEKKEISNNKDCNDLANYLSCFTFGFVNLGMKGISKEELRKTADFALLVVKS